VQLALLDRARKDLEQLRVSKRRCEVHSVTAVGRSDFRVKARSLLRRPVACATTLEIRRWEIENFEQNG